MVMPSIWEHLVPQPLIFGGRETAAADDLHCKRGFHGCVTSLYWNHDWIRTDVNSFIHSFVYLILLHSYATFCYNTYCTMGSLEPDMWLYLLGPHIWLYLAVPGIWLMVVPGHAWRAFITRTWKTISLHNHCWATWLPGSANPSRPKKNRDWKMHSSPTGAFTLVFPNVSSSSLSY